MEDSTSAFPLEVWNFGVLGTVPTYLVPSESLMHRVFKVLHMSCLNQVLKELPKSYVTPMKEDSWKLTPGFLQTSPHVPFPL